MDSNTKFIPVHGNYKELITYQKSLIIYDCTVMFCKRFLHWRDRTVDQMVQAARSGKQNILEGSMASGTSKGTEITLTNVARSSLEELLEDYHDFLRTRKHVTWDKDAKEAQYVRKLSAGKILPPKYNGTDETNGTNDKSEAHTSHESHTSHIYNAFLHFLETRPSEICANIMICLINQCNYLLDKQIRKLEEDFVKEGGLREKMYNARINYRNTNK